MNIIYHFFRSHLGMASECVLTSDVVGKSQKKEK
jgi:hypothetical protein